MDRSQQALWFLTNGKLNGGNIEKYTNVDFTNCKLRGHKILFLHEKKSMSQQFNDVEK